jgi:putative oxidoreductase
MLRRLFSDFYGGRMGVALLLLRTVVGLAFVFHGLPKVRDVAGFATHLNLPHWLAALAAYAEVVGGALLVLGLLTPLVALTLAIQMLVALFKVHVAAGHPFVATGGPSFELALVYLCVMVAFLLVGPGLYSLDGWMVKKTLEEDEVEAALRRPRSVA